MFKLEENKNIGIYLGKLIDNNFSSKRQFCRAYLRTSGETSDDENVQKMANRVSQILKGKKSIQTYDLPIFSELFEVSCEEILSAGKCFVPVENRMTNYKVAFVKDEQVWEKYIHREDKLILNPDEYGKTVIDYALEFKNFEFLKYLMEKKYIWFVDEKETFCPLGYGAGTSIEKRKPYEVDCLDGYLKRNDSLRRDLISLAIENDDFEVLNQLRAREIIPLYLFIEYGSRNVEYDDYVSCRNKNMLIHISNASEKILDYFSEEFEIENSPHTLKKFIFPYIVELIELLIKNGNEYAKLLLKRLIEHNRNVHDLLKKIIHEAYQSEVAQWENNTVNFDSDFIRERNKTIMSSIVGILNLQCKANIVAFKYPALQKDINGIIANIFCMEQKYEKGELFDLIQELNDWYNKICSLRESLL